MSGSLAYILVFLPLLSRVTAFGRCDASIILNIENSNLTAFPAPKIALFSGQRFSYPYVSSSDKDVFVSAEIIFQNSTDNKTVCSTLNRYLNGPTKSPTSISITFTDIGDVYEVNAKGFIDSPSSNLQVYIWQVQGVVVAYYCSLDCPCTDTPLFTLNTPITTCSVTAAQLQACQASINLVNNNVPVPLSGLKNPPTSNCSKSTP